MNIEKGNIIKFNLKGLVLTGVCCSTINTNIYHIFTCDENKKYRILSIKPGAIIEIVGNATEKQIKKIEYIIRRLVV